MPIIIDAIGQETGQPDPQEDLHSRVARLEGRLAQLEVVTRDLRNYCDHLEQACRDAFGQVPGTSPFPVIHR